MWTEFTPSTTESLGWACEVRIFPLIQSTGRLSFRKTLHRSHLQTSVPSVIHPWVLHRHCSTWRNWSANPILPVQTETRQFGCVFTKLELKQSNATHCMDRVFFASANRYNFLALYFIFVVPENISPYKNNAIFNSHVLQIVVLRNNSSLFLNMSEAIKRFQSTKCVSNKH